MSTAHPATASPSVAPVRVRGWVETHQVGSFFILTFVLSWSLWLLAYLSGEGPLAMVLFLIGGFGPVMSAAAITRYTGGSVKEWARAIVHWRVPARFYLYAVGLPALIWTVINIELALFSDRFDVGLLPQRLGVSVGTFLVVLTVGGGFEEPGWRGFALGRLQERLSPVRATLLLGFVWGIWHIPVYGPLGFAFPMMLAFFYTYLYNKTGSVLLAILLHASFTPASDNFALVPRDIHGINDVVIFGTVLAAAIVLIAVTRGRLGYEPSSTVLQPAAPARRALALQPDSSATVPPIPLHTEGGS
jgi:membrane protease YdiL (CAAX protease family)